MNPGSLSAPEILQVMLKQQEVLRRDRAAQRLLATALLSQPPCATPVG